jgi:hypothetical protein
LIPAVAWGAPQGLCALLAKDTKHRVIQRKAEVVAEVRGGLLSLEEACERYKRTFNEFLSWQRSIDRHGLHAIALQHPTLPTLHNHG